MAAFERLHDRDSAEPVISGPGRIEQGQMAPKAPFPRSPAKQGTSFGSRAGL